MVLNIVTMLMPIPAQTADRSFAYFLQAYRVSLRFLTKLLIAAFLLLSAITFSTEKIPNFKPDVTINWVSKSEAQSKKVILPRPLLLVSPKPAVPHRYSSPTRLQLPAERELLTPPSRAPPSPSSR